MTRRTMRIVQIGLTVLTLVLGASFFVARHAGARDFYCAVVNRTPTMLRDVSVTFDDKKARFGVLVAGGRASYGPFSLPSPSECVVEWIGGDGAKHAVRQCVLPADGTTSIIEAQIAAPDDVIVAAK